MTNTSVDFDEYIESVADTPIPAPAATPAALVLTSDQQAALDAFQLFLMDDSEHVFVLSGYSGCGKSTLVNHLLELLPGIQKMIALIDPKAIPYEPDLTATTNKAAENLSFITGTTVGTIHSYLGLRVSTDFRTNVTTLIPSAKHDTPTHRLVFIDEASFIDNQLLGHIFQRTRDCKIVFIGDPAQLAPVKATGTPVFEAGFTGAALSQVVRQAKDNPIVDLSTKFRHTVNTGEFFSFKPDGHHIQHMDRGAFNTLIQTEFTRPDWRYRDSKILAWTNKCVIGYNQYIRNMAKGDPHFEEGDYAVCNQFLAVGKDSIKTDQLVQITRIEPDCDRFNVPGNYVTLDFRLRTFQPKNLADKNAAIKRARAEDRIGDVAEMEERWSDLRGAFACTINKSQGSTYDAVYIDLDDIGRCNNGNQIARMLYVGVSRARSHVYMVGDLA